MVTAPRSAVNPPWGLRVDRPAEGTVVVHLSGSWRLRDRLPDGAEIQREIDAGPPVRRLTFETGEMTAWDSGLLSVLWEVIGPSGRKGIELDPGGLPADAWHLLSVACATPPRELLPAPATGRPSWVDRVGRAAQSTAVGAGRMLTFLGEVTVAFSAFVRGRARFLRSDLATLLEESGVRALPIVSLISFLVGVILAYVGAAQLQRFGAEVYVADLVAIATVRELGPIMTSIILAGRTGAAFAATLGTMQVREEIDALVTTGLSPLEFLVLPRMLALSLMTPLLTIYGNLIGVLGGACVATTLLGVSGVAYVHATIGALRLADIGVGLIKASVFGVLVAFAGCLRGSQSGRSAAAVGQAATAAVVLGIVLIIASDAILDVIFNVLSV